MRKSFFETALSLVLVGLGSLSQAAIWTVAPEGPADFNNLAVAVNKAASGDILALADGIYRGQDNRGIRIGDKSLTLRGRDSAACILDMQGGNQAFYIQANADLTLENVTLRNGAAGNGGALRLYGGLLKVTDCLFIDNIASGAGGAIYVDYGECLVQDCLFLRNTAFGNGGALAVGWSTEQVHITDSRFYHNQGRQGGAVALESYNGLATLERCILAHNTAADDGGGLRIYYGGATLVNCEITDNQAQGQGGGIYGYGGPLELVHCTINANRSEQEAGGVYAYYVESFTMLRCAVTQNQGGGVWWYYWSEDTCQIQTCLFQDNEGWDWYDDWKNQSIRGAASLNYQSYAQGNITGNPAYAFAHHTRILGTSACIDPGTVENPDEWPPSDLEGVTHGTQGSRVVGGSPDIGAYEYSTTPLIAVSERVVCLETEVQGGAATVILQARNAGGGMLDLSASSDVPWLHVDPNRASLDSDNTLSLQLVAEVQGLTRGLYLGRLTLTDAQAANGPVVVPVVLRVLGTLEVPATYASLAEAVGEAMAGETVTVRGGTYAESVTLQRPIRLIGCEAPELLGVTVRTDGATVSGLTCTGSGTGLQVLGSENVIHDNTLVGNRQGLAIQGGADNRVTNNTIRACTDMGLLLSSSPGNFLRDNTLTDNAHGVDVSGAFDQDIDSSNTVDGRPIVFLRNVQDRVIHMGTNPACVYLVGCTDIVVMGVTLTNQGKGVCLIDSSDVTVRQTTCTGHSQYGILVQGGHANYLIGNTVRDCPRGLLLTDGTGYVLRNNHMWDTELGFACSGQNREQYNHQIDATNTWDDRPIIYLLDSEDVVVDAATQAACVYAIGCRNVTISGLDLRHNRDAVLLYDTQQARLENLTLQDNEIGVSVRGESSDITLLGLTLGDNNYGLNVQNALRVTVTDCVARDNGTGLYLYSVEEAQVDRCRITGNGIGLENSNSAMTVQNCMITGNTQRGGIYLNSSRANLIQFCTIVGNALPYYYSPEEGGGISGYYDGLKLENCILWGNSPGQVPSDSWNTQTVLRCDVQGGFPGSNNLDQDPLVTPDGHLRLASPCRGRGLSTTRLSLDFDGESRTIQSTAVNGLLRTVVAAARTSSGSTDIGADYYLDADADGLPDWIERYKDPAALSLTPDGDEDGDGRTNLEEYEIYGTHPCIPATVYYVDPALGCDDQDGLSWETPLRTVAEAALRAQSEDNIVLAEGVYEGDVTFETSSVTIQSRDPHDPNNVAQTILAGTVSFAGSETRACRLEGITLSTSATPAVKCGNGASATLSRCTLCDMGVSPGLDLVNESGLALIYCASQGNLLLENCTVVDNQVPLFGVLYMDSSKVTLRHCLVAGNQGGLYAQAFLVVGGDLVLENCTVADNQALGTIPPDLFEEVGDVELTLTQPAILGLLGASVAARNCIFWNEPGRPEIDNWLLDGESVLNATLDYCTLSQLPDPNHVDWQGDGVLTDDPLFAGFGDYHLQSQGARWDTSQGWVQDALTSPCIDAGDPQAHLGAEPMPASLDRTDLRNDRLNQGVYGGTAEASLRLAEAEAN